MKVKISVIGSRGYPFVYSGYETFIKELVERLDKNKYSVTVYCHRGLFSERPQKVNGINLVYVPTIESKKLSQLIHSFQSFIHVCLSDSDIVLVVNSANGPFGLLTKTFRKKTIINVDGLEWLRPKWKGLGAKYFYFASKLATKLFDVIVNDSTAMAEFYKKEFKCDSTVIAYGANIRYSTNPGLIEKWGLEKEGYYLIVGRLIPDNNADLIIREFIKSKSEKKLVVIGDVPYKDLYAENIKSLTDKRLIFTGYVNNQEELAEFYHNCFAYFHGHEFGGTNPTMLKALAYGCAIIALDTVFTREMLSAGEYGLFFKKDSDNLSGLIDIVDNDHEFVKMYRNKARNRIVENYTWEKIVDQYSDLFQKLTERKK